MNIVLAITGSIASFKSYDVARMLVKNGHAVKVVLTSGALEFIKPETFRYLGIEATYLPTDDFKPEKLSKDSTVLHIELAKWADKLVIAPLGASTLARLNLGLNNDLLVSLYLALGNKPVLMFPAMNTEMWKHPATQDHISQLKQQSHVEIINPVSGLLACGDIGAGKFPEVTAVVDLIETLTPNLKKNKKIIVTAGATASPLDPVRYLTNPSSGKQGITVAKAFLQAGYDVTLFAGHQCTPEVENLLGHPNFTMLKTPTTSSMQEAALKLFPGCDLYISTGAIADIEFDIQDKKIKKESLDGNLTYKIAADILRDILKLKKSHQKVISFAAETETTKEVFQEKMKRKPTDLMIGNKVSSGLLNKEEMTGFQRADGEYYFVTQDDMKGPFPLTKKALAQKLVSWFEGKVTW